MSLIHKALQKAQETRDKFKTEPAKVSSLDIKDEKEGSFGKNSVRSIALVAVLVVVLGVFAYSKFFPSKKTFTDAASPIPAAEVTGQVEEATNGSDTEMKNDIVELFSNKKYDKALKLAQGSYLLNPKDADILNSMGVLHRRKGNLKEARNYISQAIEIKEDCAECWNNLGLVEIDQGNNLEAGLDIRRALEYDPKQPNYYFNLAVVMEKEGNFKSAISNYKTYLKLSEDEELAGKVEKRIEFLSQ